MRIVNFNRNQRAACLAAMLLASLIPASIPAQESGSTSRNQDVPLVVGSPAPAFRVGRWLKGDPITELKRGHNYVIEFWGTQCAPCIAGFPDLTKLAKDFQGKVTVIGVGLTQWARGKPYPKSSDADQDRFMAEHGPAMGYTVVMDTPDAHMAVNWMRPAWELGKVGGGIPMAVVVGGDGKIVWAGRPDALRPVLEKLTGESK